MKRAVLGVLAALALFTPSPAAAFTMDDVLSAPYLSNLTASPDGTAIAWAVHVRGRRNLYAFAGGKIVALTRYTQDDGQQISGISFLPANDAVIFLRGGEDGNIGDNNPNPTALAKPPERAVMIVGFDGKDPRQLGVGHNPVVSPKGDRVVWISHGSLLSATLTHDDSGYAFKMDAPQFQVKGGVRHVVFSPDGTRIAFVNGRGDHGFIGVYRFGDSRVVYLKPDFTNDNYPAWSPDGSRVAFVRAPGFHEEFSPYEAPEKQPWSIWTGNPDTGSAKRVFEARRGEGSEYYTTPESDAQLFWTGDDIAFTWEGTGWNQLYKVSSSGGNARALTRGNFEVEGVRQTLDKRGFLIASNRGDIDRRHISIVNANGATHALTTGAHDQWSPVALADGKYAYIDAGYNAVATIVDTAASPQRLTAEPVPAAFPAQSMIEPKLVTFKSTDGWTVHAQLFVPRDGKRSHPGLIFNHGGPERQMLPGFHYMEAYTNLFESNEYFVNHGFEVLSINYRTGIMYGEKFRDAKFAGPQGAREYYRDVLAGTHFLMNQPGVDRKRIGIYGLSYGGYLAAMALAHNSDIFKAAADYAGVHNWVTLLDSDFGQKAGTPEQRAVAYKNSPVGALAGWKSPVFLSQGDDDRNVAFSQGVDLAWRLRERNIPVETLVFPNETHENLVYVHMVDLFQKAADFLSTHLK